jgi:hypothetical protein
MKKCHVISLSSRDVCMKTATLRVKFPDGDASNACQGCALHLQQLAASYGTVVVVQPIEE